MDRHIDGLYSRIQRNGKWNNVCFSDLTIDEREQVCEGKSIQWLKAVLFYITDCLQNVAEEFDIRGDNND